MEKLKGWSVVRPGPKIMLAYKLNNNFWEADARNCINFIDKVKVQCAAGSQKSQNLGQGREDDIVFKLINCIQSSARPDPKIMLTHRVNNNFRKATALSKKCSAADSRNSQNLGQGRAVANGFKLKNSIQSSARPDPKIMLTHKLNNNFREATALISRLNRVILAFMKTM